MKYNVMGFYQPRAVELGLCSDDLLVLRWFVDYVGTDKMRTLIIDNRIYYWVNYDTVLKELPILKIKKQTLYKKHFMNLCDANVLIHKQVKEGGNFSYYCYGINYQTLLYLQVGDTPLVKNTDLEYKHTQGAYENTEPCVQTYQTLEYKHTEQILNHNNIIQQDKNIKENKKESSLEDYEFSNSVKSMILVWLGYKKEKGQTYKPTGLKTLLNTLFKWQKEFGDEYVVRAIDRSIANNYAGIFPENKSREKVKTQSFEKRQYTSEELNSVFDSLKDVEL